MTNANEVIINQLQEIKAILRETLSSTMDPERSLSTVEAAQFLSMSKRSFYVLVRAGSIPHYGRKYVRRDLIGWREKHRRFGTEKRSTALCQGY